MTDEQDTKPGAPRPAADEEPPGFGRLLSLTRPTWELELLISGAVIFSLFQLPGLLAGLYFGVEHHLSGRLMLVPTLLYYGAMLCVLVLLVGFVLHFLARGFWVALCGLNVVFPEGILWDRLDVGPVQREYLQRHTPPARTLEERADRFASTIFPLLFYMLISTAVASAWMVGAMVVLGGLLRWAFPALPELAILYGVLLLFMAPVLVVILLDSRYKKHPERLERAPARRRRMLALLRVWHRYMVLQPLYGAIPLTFQTHFSTRKATWAFGSVSVLFAGVFLVIFLLQAGLFGYDSYAYLPERGEELVIQADHYEALRAAGSRARVPTIQSDVATGPYLRLFVPYRPTSDRELLVGACSEVEPLRAEGIFVRPLLDRRVEKLGEEGLRPILDCFARVWRVTMDGEEVRPEWEFYRQPERGTAGLVAHLRVAGLEGGRHELVVVKRPEGGEREEGSGEGEGEDVDEDEARYVIPFWR